LLEGDSVQYRILQVSFVFGGLCFMTWEIRVISYA
jgi:hypothetical protein